MDADPELGGGADPQDQVQTLRDPVQTLKDQVDGVKDIMTQNVERILARGERLDELQGKSEDLQAGAQTFKQTSQKVARSYWWKNVKLVVVIIVVVLIIVLVIVLLATGVIPVSNPAPPIAPPHPPPPQQALGTQTPAHSEVPLCSSPGQAGAKGFPGDFDTSVRSLVV
ncbi:vesicle-associated membrane protein 8 isoform 1-T2 [Menidia menidia]